MHSRFQSAVGFGVAAGVCALVWAVWSESFAPRTLIEGLLLSALALWVTNRFLLRGRYQERFHLPPLVLLRYLGVLLTEIFRAGVHAMAVTLRGRIELGVIDLPTRLTDPLHKVLVANAVTLTPGTVTLDVGDGFFKVLWIDCRTADPEEAAESIKGRFERVFRRDDGGRDGASPATTPGRPPRP